jgi:hypothetical protein
LGSASHHAIITPRNVVRVFLPSPSQTPWREGVKYTQSQHDGSSSHQREQVQEAVAKPASENDNGKRKGVFDVDDFELDDI